MLNNMKVFVMTAGLTALFVVVGGALGGQQGMIVVASRRVLVRADGAG